MSYCALWCVVVAGELQRRGESVPLVGAVALRPGWKSSVTDWSSGRPDVTLL